MYPEKMRQISNRWWMSLVLLAQLCVSLPALATQTLESDSSLLSLFRNSNYLDGRMQLKDGQPFLLRQGRKTLELRKRVNIQRVQTPFIAINKCTGAVSKGCSLVSVKETDIYYFSWVENNWDLNFYSLTPVFLFSAYNKKGWPAIISDSDAPRDSIEPYKPHYVEASTEATVSGANRKLQNYKGQKNLDGFFLQCQDYDWLSKGSSSNPPTDVKIKNWQFTTKRMNPEIGEETAYSNMGYEGVYLRRVDRSMLRAQGIDNAFGVPVDEIGKINYPDFLDEKINQHLEVVDPSLHKLCPISLQIDHKTVPRKYPVTQVSDVQVIENNYRDFFQTSGRQLLEKLDIWLSDVFDGNRYRPRKFR
jgi:hypothetical protein